MAVQEMTFLGPFGWDDPDAEVSHSLVFTERDRYGWWGECSCGWTTGPDSSEEDVQTDHYLHRKQRRRSE